MQRGWTAQARRYRWMRIAVVLCSVACSSVTHPEGGTTSSDGGGGKIAVATGGKPTGSGGTSGASGAGGAGAGGVPVDATGGSWWETCATISFAPEIPATDIYILIDKSTSMEELLGTTAFSKWENTVSAIQTFVQLPAAVGTGVGIQYFGLADTCNPDAYAVPAIPISVLPTGGAEIVASTSSETPSTLTPTAPALQGGLLYMQAWASAHPHRTAVVLLATDGLPTQCGVQCTSPADCLSNTCTNGVCEPGTSIAEIAALAERYATADPPVFTAVLGVGEGLSNLDNIALAGGTGEAILVEGGDVEQGVAQGLLDITRDAFSCSLYFPTPTDLTGIVDTDLIRLIYEEGGVTMEIPRLGNAGDCALNNDEGWYYDYAPAPTRLLLCPETCRRYVPGQAEIQEGCHPIEWIP